MGASPVVMFTGIRGAVCYSNILDASLVLFIADRFSTVQVSDKFNVTRKARVCTRMRLCVHACTCVYEPVHACISVHTRVA